MFVENEQAGAPILAGFLNRLTYNQHSRKEDREMRVLKTIVVPLHDLQRNLFVRKELDTERAWFLSELIESGVKMHDNIKATRDLVIVDGRHRWEAYDLNKVIEVEVDIVDIVDEVTLIAEAYKANIGGSKPPTAEDTNHTIELLIERKQSIKAIGELMALPSSMARKYVTEVKSRLNRAKMMAAVNAVTHGGLNVAQAATQYEVEAEKLKEALSGTRKKHKESEHGVDELHRGLTRQYKSISSTNAATLRKLLEQYEDGDVTPEQVQEIIKHIESLQKKTSRALADWKQRFQAKYKENKGEAGAEAAA